MKITTADDHYQNNFRGWKRRDNEGSFYRGFPRAPDMEELAEAADKSKLIVHQFQKLEVSCSDALENHRIRMEHQEARSGAAISRHEDAITAHEHRLRDHGHSIRRDRDRMNTLVAEVKELKIANGNLTKLVRDSETRNNALAERLSDSEAKVDALEIKVDGLLIALQSSVATFAEVKNSTKRSMGADPHLPADEAMARELILLRREHFVPDEVEYLLDASVLVYEEIGEGMEEEDV